MTKEIKKTSKKLSRTSKDNADLDIKIKLVNYQKYDDIHESKLTLDFYGSDVNTSLINTIRRVCLDDIPIYAFPSEFIKIEANNTIFNNDYMRARLIQIPILDCDSEIDYLESNYLNYDDPNYVKHEKEKILEIYINSYNNTPENINITTNDINFIEDGEPKEKYSKKFPILITQLRPNETFKAHMKAALSTGLKSKIFSATNSAYYDFDEENKKISFTIESSGQLNEFNILEKSIKYILKKLDDFKNNFNERLKINSKYEKNSTLVFEFNNEDHTFGEILNTTFQDHPKIIFSGLSKMSPLERLIKIKISSSDENPLIYMIESVDHLKNIYNNILKELKKNSK